ncbi:MAG TPA: M3 family metallopeptidase [Candidatus Sulfotelmatobacter sp.]|nr:M3 family metallopeptidase [Candidatus Sulfotelmatobacter sp.]
MTGTAISETASAPTGAENVEWDLRELGLENGEIGLRAQLERVRQDAADFAARFKGRLGELDAVELKDVLHEVEELIARTRRYQAGAYLNYCMDTSAPSRSQLMHFAHEVAADAGTQLGFLIEEWRQIDGQRRQQLLEDPRLEPYRVLLELALASADHRLSDAEERILFEKSLTGIVAWRRLYTHLVSEIRVTVRDRDISLEEAFGLLEQQEASLRSDAAAGISRALLQGVSTRALVVNNVVLDGEIDARLRGYSNWMTPSNIANQVPDDAGHSLIEAVVARYDIAQRYYRLKARLMGLERISFDADRLAPISTEADAEGIPWANAKAIILGAYAAFSPALRTAAEDFFEKRWIDARPSPHKVPHAFTTAVPGAHPYILLTYNGSLRSLLTLAHELGQGVQAALSAKQGALPHSSLVMSETASLFSERIVFSHLIAAEPAPLRRRELKMILLDSVMNMVFRHVAITRFEEAVRSERRSRGELSAEDISKLWVDAHHEMLGDAVALPQQFGTWWSCVPHLVDSPGHEQLHSMSSLLAQALHRRCLEEPESAEGVVELLMRGGATSPQQLVHPFGIDLGAPDSWRRELDALDSLITEAEPSG